ncbi:MAG: ABC transporter ATP-binding protein [Planctomycetota bacterium]
MSRFNTLAQPRREAEAAGGFSTFIWSLLAGLLVPVLVILLGLIAVLLNQGGLGGTSVQLGTHLRLPLEPTFAAQTPLVQLTELVGISFAVAAVFSMSIWLQRRSADDRARRIVKELHKRVLSQSLRRAELEGAAAQHVRAQQLIGEQLPSIQAGLSMWFRAIPRSLITFVGCVIVALLVNLWLAMLAVVSGILLWQLLRRLRNSDDGELNQWEVPRTRNRMAELVGQAPLLARLQSQGLADQAFGSELDLLYRRLTERDGRTARVWPMLFLAISAAVAVLVLGLGVNLIEVDSSLGLPSALVLGLALGGAIAAAGRLLRLASQLRVSGEASDSVYHYLKRSSEIAPSEQRVGLAGLRESVEIQDVTLMESTGQPILSHLGLKLQPGTLVSLLGTDPVSTRALAELLMGFGLPSEGRVTIDGISLRDVHPQALARNVMWIEPDGPLWDGTIYENLRGGDDSISNSEIVDALSAVGVYDALQRLPEGLNTMVSAGDSMLGVESTYAIATARALLHKPPVLLALEPLPPAEHLAEDPCLKAFRKLVSNGTLVIILPRRLQTLRTADRVVLLNGPRLVGEGKHADLLANSDLYRHLNYLLFNPYRHQKNESE